MRQLTTGPARFALLPVRVALERLPLSVWSIPIPMAARSHAHTILNACVYCVQLCASITHSGHDVTETVLDRSRTACSLALARRNRALARTVTRKVARTIARTVARRLAQTLARTLARTPDARTDARSTPDRRTLARRTLARTLSLGHSLHSRCALVALPSLLSHALVSSHSL